MTDVTLKAKLKAKIDAETDAKVKAALQKIYGELFGGVTTQDDDPPIPGDGGTGQGGPPPK